MKRQYARMMEEDATTATSTSEYRFYLQLLDECNAKKKEPPPPYVTEDESRYCPIAFDGWTCWDYTPAGTVAYNPCPFFIVGFDPRRYAFRPCLENGTWFHHPQSNQTWSNYTTCVDVDDLQFRQMVNHLYITGYTISVIALLLSLIIFFSFRSLKCTRIAIHVQLFLSFAANNLMWIVWYHHVVGNVNELKENGWACQALHVILQYLMVANYMWMFCEGLHLHLALVVVFVKDEIVMRWFYFVGWGFPGIITAAYTIARTRKVEYTKQCWMNESVTQWILIAPVLLSLVASLVFLVNVVRVLLTKLHSNSANPAPVGMRKAVRATLILVPLFGLQHILLPFRPEPNQPGERFYQLFSAVVISLQGFCVSCLFCFANVDVHCAIRPLIRRIFPWVGRPACGESGNLCNAVNTHTQSRDVCV
ncbi:calcitonin receptor [Anabrus simplex]|uniref:calcitonin receptor n=1 Tax=Anabrus simplex TaxID=316456 RepID=UPI0034DCED63